MMNDSSFSLEELAITLFDIGAVQLGKFKLHGGAKSRIYLDLRLLVSHPSALRLATKAYRSVLETLTFDILSAAPLAGLPLGTAVCLDMDKPLVYPRKMVKNYGMGKTVEGAWKVGQTAVILDDLITSGDSILQAVVSLKAAGLQVRDAVVLIDREQGGTETLAQNGYQLHSVITLNRLLGILENAERISAKQRAKVIKSLTK